ncbi:hypothetical protein [Tenacibaculum haliotis]|uniref:hypothetical protein n=1 Tax=Tenacibaculum haliotis TaxID=1888914 RepID=UPI0021AF0760|nr:hypothetical protein [Tenacibaculum haliotis]MCT4698049.1 hypothetical protein [Tenacibaculum haliotis]
MDTNERSLCSTCNDVNSCNLTSNKVFIWSCSEFMQEKVSENKTTTKAINFNAVKSKKELELI